MERTAYSGLGMPTACAALVLGGIMQDKDDMLPKNVQQDISELTKPDVTEHESAWATYRKLALLKLVCKGRASSLLV